MKVTIKSTHVDEKKWAKGDRDGVIRTQDAIFETQDSKGRMRLDLGKNEPFAVGEYNCDLEDNFVVNNFGDPALSRRLRLVPTAAAAGVKRVA